MRRAIVLCCIAVAVLVAGVASHAFLPRPAPAIAAAHKPARVPEPAEHHIRVRVSGPDDTLMRVARGAARTQVALQGKPFEHAFTEPADSDGYLRIAVAAASRTPGDRPVRCEISVDGDVVAQQATRELDSSGLAQVMCQVPAPV